MQSSKRREQEKFFEKIRQEDQWRSQAQGGHGGMGTSPSGVQGRGPGGGLWAKPPEAGYIQTVCSCQNNAFLRRSAAESDLNY